MDGKLGWQQERGGEERFGSSISDGISQKSFFGNLTKNVGSYQIMILFFF